MKPIKQVLQERMPELMVVPGVVGVGRGEHEGVPCIVVMVTSRTPEVERDIPDRVDGYAVSIRIMGELESRED